MVIPSPLPPQWALIQSHTACRAFFAWELSLFPSNPGSWLQPITDRSWYMSIPAPFPFGWDMLLENPICNTVLYELILWNVWRFLFCPSTWRVVVNFPWVLETHQHTRNVGCCVTGCYQAKFVKLFIVLIFHILTDFCLLSKWIFEKGGSNLLLRLWIYLFVILVLSIFALRILRWY